LAAGLIVGLAVGLAAPASAHALSPVARAFVDLLRLVAPVTLVTVVPVALGALPWRQLREVGGRAARRAALLSAVAAAIGGLAGLVGWLPAAPVTAAAPDSPWRAVTRSLDDLTLVALLLAVPLAWSVAWAADSARGAGWHRTMLASERLGRHLIEAVLMIAPLGVAALAAGFAATAASGAIGAMAGLGAMVWGAQLLAALTAAASAPLAGVSAWYVLRGARDALVTAFVTGSSAATLPVEWRSAERQLGVPPALAALLVPAGTLVSKLGTTAFLATLAVAALRWTVGDVELSAWMAATVGAFVLGAVTPPVAGGGLVMLGVLTAWVGADPGLAPVLIAIPFVGKLNTPLNVLGRLLVVTSVRSRQR